MTKHGMKLVEKIDNDLPILIHSADCILEKDIELNIPDYDVGVITKNYRRAFFKFENYGWVNSMMEILQVFQSKKNHIQKTQM